MVRRSWAPFFHLMSITRVSWIAWSCTVLFSSAKQSAEVWSGARVWVFLLLLAMGCPHWCVSFLQNHRLDFCYDSLRNRIPLQNTLSFLVRSTYFQLLPIGDDWTSTRQSLHRKVPTKRNATACALEMHDDDLNARLFHLWVSVTGGLAQCT